MMASGRRLKWDVEFIISVGQVPSTADTKQSFTQEHKLPTDNPNNTGKIKYIENKQLVCRLTVRQSETFLHISGPYLNALEMS